MEKTIDRRKNCIKTKISLRSIVFSVGPNASRGQSSAAYTGPTVCSLIACRLILTKQLHELIVFWFSFNWKNRAKNNIGNILEVMLHREYDLQ
jgi:hypothetical protein